MNTTFNQKQQVNSTISNISITQLEKDVLSFTLTEKELLGYVDVIRLARHYNIEVYAEEDKNKPSAWIKYNKPSDKFIITTNSSHSYNRQRFSIAHEIAHFILHTEQIKERWQIDRDGEHSLLPEEETRADELAASILIPESLILKFVEQEGLDFNHITITRLAESFKVSLMVVILRLKNLNYRVPYINMY